MICINLQMLSSEGEIVETVRLPAPPPTIENPFEICEEDLSSGSMSSLFRSALHELKPDEIKKIWIKASNLNVRQSIFSDSFRVDWSTRSHRIREYFNDDRYLTSILWKILPPYSGGDLNVWRGEQKAKFDCGIVGLNWSISQNVGLMFARGLSASYKGGGVLLRAKIKAANVISGKGTHPIDNDELPIVADPSGIYDIEALSYYEESY